MNGEPGDVLIFIFRLNTLVGGAHVTPEQCSRTGCEATRRCAAVAVTRCSRTCRDASASVQPATSAPSLPSSAARCTLGSTCVTIRYSLVNQA